MGAACWYAGAADLRGFWQDVLAQRAGFRRIPSERLSLHDYGLQAAAPQGGQAAAAPGSALDRTYVTRAAVIDGFVFDWRKRRIPRDTVATTDVAHWLALEVALAAVEHAGIDLATLDRQRVGVVVGNSLTGETSRANLLRLRWPYVQHAIVQAVAETGAPQEGLAALLAATERCFKAPLPEPNEDSLAGSLSNVIAGRIANKLDLFGGAFTVDGACASSLLAIAMACDGIAAGRWDMVIVGGVDVSLDPFELVGFARVGAMTRETMRVYDERSSGFLPGEGAGFVVLESAASARRAGRTPLAHVNGWGVSSDGAGGITAPSAVGQAAAMRRAYQQAGYAMNTVRFVEGHGTGTPLGDAVELAAMQDVAGPSSDRLRGIGLTSAKTLFGHTKAASGAAGFIKAVLAVNQRVLPPLPRTGRPHGLLRQDGSALYALAGGEILDGADDIRAGVSGAGFGGINCHVTLSSPASPPLDLGGPGAALLLASAQTAELVLAAAPTAAALAEVIASLQRDATGISDGELIDFAAEASSRLGTGAWRCAVVADDAEDLARKLAQAAAALAAGIDAVTTLPGGDVVIGHFGAAPRVGFLLPGQGAQFLGMGGALARRFPWAAARLQRWDGALQVPGQDGLAARILRPVARAADDALLDEWRAGLQDTRWAQSAVALTALNWAEYLVRLGIAPAVVAGHSLGELPAVALAGAIDEAELIAILKIRAAASAAPGPDAAGVMSSLICGPAEAQALVDAVAGYCVLANHNAPDRTVIAGAPAAVAAVEGEAALRGIASVRLPVSNAFHSRYMAPASVALAGLAPQFDGTRRLRLPFVSGLSGEAMTGDIDVIGYARAQIVAPVRYVDLVSRMAELADLFVELGPGQIQTGLVARILGAGAPAFALETGPDQGDQAFCAAIGQMFVRGCPVQPAALFEGRLVRPFLPTRARVFIANPCEAIAAGTAPAPVALPVIAIPPAPLPVIREAPLPVAPVPVAAGVDGLAELRRVVAAMTGYEVDMVEPSSRLGADLNLDSIKIAELGARLSRLGWSNTEPAMLQRGTVAEIAAAMRQVAAASAGPADAPQAAAAIVLRDLPVHAFTVKWHPCDAAPPAAPAEGATALFFESRQGAEALRLAAALDAAGQACVLLPWRQGGAPPAAGAAGKRLVALLPRIMPGTLGEPALADRLAGYLGVLGSLLARGIDELVLAGGADTAGALTIDGLGLGGTVLLEGLARRVRVLRLEGGEPDAPLDGRALTTPFDEPFEYLRLTGATLACARLEPVLDPSDGPIGLEDGDLLLVTGGLRGITAECTLALARERRLRVLVVGRTAEAALDAETTANLDRLRAACLAVEYCACDVGDAAAVEAVLRPRLAAMGVLRGILHGAGVNLAAPLQRLAPADVAREITVKVGGLANLLGLADLGSLRLCAGLGSVIATTGMHGNAGYALANELMAAQLAALQAAHPHVTVACPAFSVWRDVGMGTRLGAAMTETLAATAIDPAAGAAAFLASLRRGAIAPPLVIAVPMTGLATWRHLRAAPPPDGARFLAPLLAHEPGLLLLARPALSHATDPYLNHHNFQGTALFPTVFALEAFVSAAVALGAVARHAPVTIDGLVLSRPIVVDAGDTRVIELDARLLPGVAQVRAVLGDPGRAVLDPIMAATIAPALDVPIPLPAIAGEAPHADLSAHLYAAVLFQGAPFQRIECVERIDLTDPVKLAAVFRVRRDPNAALHTRDPFFLDGLLQTVQVLVPQDICLPRAIGRVTIGPAMGRPGPVQVHSRITARTADGYLCQVVAIDPVDSALVAAMDDFDVGIVEHRAERPSLADLRDPEAYDAKRVMEARDRLRRLGLPDGCTLAMTALGHADARQARRVRAQALVARLLAGADMAGELDWDGDGRPVLAGLANPQGVSVSHAGGRMVAVLGPPGLACDLEQVRRRPRDEWVAMLPRTLDRVLSALTSRLANPDLAATMLWTAHECLIKFGIDGGAVHVESVGADGVAFAVDGGLGRVVATVIDLALAGQCVLAVLDGQAATAPATIARGHTTFCHRFRPTFRDITTLQRTVAAHSLFGWVGETREQAMASIHGELAAAFSPPVGQSGGHAMVTNFTEVDVHAPISFGQELEVTTWLHRVLEEQPSTFELGLLWRQAPGGPGGGLVLATARQRLTWVRGQGVGFRPEPFPRFFRDFLDARRLGAAASAAIFGPAGPPERFADTRNWRKSRHAADAVAASVTLDTDLSHSNFVANIYFSHYATMMERAALKLLATLPAPGWRELCVASLRIDHLGEASPGDRLTVTVELEEIGDQSILLSGRFVNETHGGAAIAIGQARLRPQQASDGRPGWGRTLPALPAAFAPLQEALG